MKHVVKKPEVLLRRATNRGARCVVRSLTACLVLVGPAAMRRALAAALTSFDRNGEEEEEEEEENLRHLTSTLHSAKAAHLLGWSQLSHSTLAAWSHSKPDNTLLEPGYGVLTGGVHGGRGGRRDGGNISRERTCTG